MRVRFLFLGALLAAASCRIGFEELPPGGEDSAVLTSLTAAANVGGRAGEITLSFVYADDLDDADFDRLEIRRAVGFAPPADCDSGEIVATVTSLAETSVVDTIADLFRRVHSYRACGILTNGNVITSDVMTFANALFFNPGPGCHAPPCDPPTSTAPGLGSFVRGTGLLASTASERGDALLADLNEDGALDVIVAADGTNVIHRGMGDGQFGIGVPVSNRSLNSVAAVVGDFDSDGNKDIVFANNDGSSFIYLGNGSGQFDDGSAVYAGTFSEMFDVEAVDLNSDNNLDLIFTRFGAEDLIYLGDGAGGFTFLRELTGELDNSCVNCLQVADVDGDRVSDVIIGYNTGDIRLNVFRGKGNAEAEFEVPFSVGFGDVRPIVVRPRDVDGDGNLDLVVGQSLSGGLFVTFGDGLGGFTPLAEIPTTTTARLYGLAVSDFDGDGDIDIVFSQDADGVIAYLDGRGGGQFAAQVELDGGGLYSTSNIDIGDVNGDGKLDFLVGIATDGSRVFLGQ